MIDPVGPNIEPDGGMVVKVMSPEGYVLRFHHGDALHDQSESRCSYPFRLSHVNFNCADIEASNRFFQSTLGFQLTDRSRAMAFLSCNQDHHAVVLADSGLNGLNHVAWMMPDLESVMRGSGRMIDQGFPIGWGVGRHGPGDNVFAYFVDPFGFVIEYTAEVLQVNDDYQPHGPEYWVWPPGRTDHWGIAPPKPDYVKHAQLAIPFATLNLTTRIQTSYSRDRSSESEVVEKKIRSMTRNSEFDVAIVGFGPAGAVAACWLGQAGVKTLVVEKSRTVWEIPSCDGFGPRNFEDLSEHRCCRQSSSSYRSLWSVGALRRSGSTHSEHRRYPSALPPRVFP